MRDDIAALASKASNVGALKKALKSWRAGLIGDQRIADTITQPAVMADLAGQMFVRSIELKQEKRILDVDPRPAFLRLPFAEALAFWKEAGGKPEQLELVLRHYGDRHITDERTRLLVETLSRNTIARVERIIAEGGTLRDFARGVQDDSVGLGISPASSGYLQTVFRTNVLGAYGAGRFRQLTDPVVVAARPWIQYRSADDNRVRASHQALNGLIFRNSDKRWYEIAPPNGYNCRCTCVSLDDDGRNEEVGARTGRLASSVPADAQIDRDFAGPPTRRLDEVEDARFS